MLTIYISAKYICYLHIYLVIYITKRQITDFNMVIEHVNVISIIDGGQKRCRENGRSPKNILSNGELRDAIDS